MSSPRVPKLHRLSSNVKGDLMGGLTAGVVALPLALGFGVASGLGAEAGLYGAIVLGIVAALFGGTPAQVSGPTGPMTVVTAAVVGALTGHPAWIFATFVLAGLIQILLGVLRLGSLVRYIPHPVVSAFMSGIGVIIIVLQLLPMLGQPASGAVLQSLGQLPSALAALNLPALGLGLAAIAIVYLSPKVVRGVPGTLVALVVTTVASLLLDLPVPRLGDIPAGLPALNLPPLDPAMFGVIVIPAITLAALGTIDSLLTSLVADRITRTRHDSNKELIGQGLGNALGGLFGGLPGAGATMRTVVNVNAGGTGPLSGAVHGLVLLAVLLGLGPLASGIPLAALAGVLVTVGIGIIDYRGLRDLVRVPVADAVTMVLVLVLTVFVDLIQAVAIGVGLASLMMVKRLGDLEVARQGEAGPWLEERGSVQILHLQGPLFFGNAQALTEAGSHLDPTENLILDMDGVRFMDQSGAYALEELIERAEALGCRVHLAATHVEPLTLLERMGVVPGKVGDEHVHRSLEQALEAEKREALLPTPMRLAGGPA